MAITKVTDSLVDFDSLEILTSASDTGVDFTLNGNKSSNGAVASIIFENNTDSVAMIRASRVGGNNDAADMHFFTQATGGSNTERMRVHSSGNVVVSTSGAAISTFYNGAGSNVGWGGDVSGYFAAVRGATNTPLYVAHSSTGSGELINFLQDTTSRGTISYNGSVMVYGGTSDYRLKENVVDLPNATTRLNALRPVSFDWIETGENSEGFLAHEVQEQVPYAVQGTHNEVYTEEGVGEEQADLVGEPKYQQVDYGKLTPLLVKALQESNAEIEALKARIETLENA